jgi:hypothetical protein
MNQIISQKSISLNRDVEGCVLGVGGWREGFEDFVFCFLLDVFDKIVNNK